MSTTLRRLLCSDARHVVGVTTTRPRMSCELRISIRRHTTCSLSSRSARGLRAAELERPGFHKLVGFRSPDYIDRCIHLVADGHQQLSVLGSEPFVVASANRDGSDAMVGRAFAVDLDRLGAVRARGGWGIRDRGNRLRQKQAVARDPIRLVNGEDHLHEMTRRMPTRLELLTSSRPTRRQGRATGVCPLAFGDASASASGQERIRVTQLSCTSGNCTIFERKKRQMRSATRLIPSPRMSSA